YDHAFVAEAGDLFERDIVNVQFRPFEAEAAGTGLEPFREWMERQGNEPTELAMVGWINASLAFDSLLAAGPEFDRESVTAAANSFTEYTADGILHPIDWTSGHVPYTASEPKEEARNCAAYVRIEDGEFVPVAPPD